MIFVSKSALKAKMLSYFRRAERTGEDIIVTDRRKPVLRVTRFREKKSFDESFGDVRGKMKTVEPLDAPTTEHREGLHP